MLNTVLKVSIILDRSFTLLIYINRVVPSMLIDITVVIPSLLLYVSHARYLKDGCLPQQLLLDAEKLAG